MKETFLKRPKLTAVIKKSGIESPVDWIDLESRRCKTTAGYQSDLDEFEFVDSRDYDSLRGEYAGRAMQAMIGALMDKPEMLDSVVVQMKIEGYETPADMIAAGSVIYADALIRELKRPKDYKEMFGI